MAIEVVDNTQPSQPPSGDVVSMFANALERAPAETPQAPAEAAPQATPTPPAPATIAIPSDRVPEKFRANPEAVFGAYENAERLMHERAGEAAQLRRQLDEERLQRAAAEQLAKLQAAPPVQQADPWGGVKPEEAVITDTRRFADTVVSLAEKRAREVAVEEARKAGQQSDQKQTAINQANALISTFESAKDLLRKTGYSLTDEQWRQELQYIAPVIARENDSAPGILLNPKRYVEHYAYLRGSPAKPTIPTEGNPPLAARAPSVTAPDQEAKPTISREQRSVREQMASAFMGRGLMSKDEAKAYVEGK